MHSDLPALFHDLAQRLHSVVHFDYMSLILHDPVRHVMRLHILESSQPHQTPPGPELPVEETPAGWAWQTQQPLVIHDLALETRFPQIAQWQR